MFGECPHCREPNTNLAECPDCKGACCAFCWTTEDCCVNCAPARRAADDDVAALRWYERRGHLGDAPSQAHRASLMQRGLITFAGGGGIVLTVTGRALLAGLCPETGDPVEDCEHIELAEGVDLGGEGGFA
jgi:hypothetical protein